MSAPRRIFAWRYHPDNQVPRALGAWDARKSHRTKDDVDYIRADIAGRLRSALQRIADLDPDSESYAERIDAIARDALEALDGKPYVSIFDKTEVE